ncbi:MAG: rod shape-determining protein MreC [Pirellulales bacterium]
MTTFDRRRSALRPWMLLWLLSAAALLLLPDRAANTVRWSWQRLIGPPRSVVSQICDQSADYARAWGTTWSDTREAARLRLEVERLQAHVAELVAQNRVAEMGTPRSNADSIKTEGALLHALTVEARLLGPLAQSWLVERRQLDRGRRAGVHDGALVLADGPALLDRGRDAGLAADHFVLAGGHVFGRVQRSGEHTSEVRRVTDEGYRDLVTLRSPTSATAHVAAPRGIIEGDGGPLCRVFLIAADEPVSVGDVVLSASAEGVYDGPLVYGEVVRAECPSGASHWDVWMKPAITVSDVPSKVSVLCIEFNPARLARREE